MPVAPALHVAGVLLPVETHRDLYIVGDRLTFERVAGAETIADRGFVLPGLVDAHCHIGISATSTAVADIAEAKAMALINREAGVLTIRDAGSPIDYAVLDDDPDTPRLVRCGQHLAAVRRYIPGLAVECEPQQLPSAIVDQAGRSSGWVKLVGDWIDRTVGDLGPSFDAVSVKAAVEAAHEAGAKVAVHTFGESALEALIDAGVDSIEHGCGLDLELIERMAGRGAALVPTMVNVAWNFESIATQAEARFPVYADHMRRLRRRFPEVVRSAHEAGVNIYAGSDAGGGVAHGQVAEEIILLHEAGLTAVEAIAAGSWAARRWLGLTGLEEGGLADLVVYDRDPRLDPAVLRAPRRVVLRGTVVQ